MKKILSIAVFALLALASCNNEFILSNEQKPATEQKVEALVTLNLSISDKADYNGTTTKAIKQGWESGDNIYLFFSYEYEDFGYWIPTTIYKEAVITYNGSSWGVADDASQEALNSLAAHDVSIGSIYALYIAGNRRELSKDTSGEKPINSFGVGDQFGKIYGEVQEAQKTYYLLEDNTINATLDFSQLCTQVVITNIDAKDEWKIESPIDAGYTHFKSINELGVEGNEEKLLTLSKNYYAGGISNADGTAFYLAEITDATKPVYIILDNTTNDRVYYKKFPAEKSFELGKAYKLTGPVLDESGDFISDNGWNYYIEKNKIIYTRHDPSESSTIINSYELFGANLERFVYYTDLGYGEIIFDSNVTKIGYAAFYSKSNLRSISLPSSVTSIEDRAFRGCQNLVSVYLSPGVKTIGEYAFYECTSLQSINIPAEVKTIYGYAFSGCTSLQSINIPAGVKTLNAYTFFDCINIQNVTLNEGLLTIGNHVFHDCTNLANIIIPNSVKSIGQYAFKGTGLTSITIPENVSTIGTSAFSMCYNLKSIYCKATTPPTLEDIDVFYNLSSDAKIYVPKSALYAYKDADIWSALIISSRLVGYDFD